MTDRLATAREALTEAAKTFREYEVHHLGRAMSTEDAKASADSMTKAARNRDMAVKCEMAANLLAAQ